jgi:hypothetical protein
VTLLLGPEYYYTVDALPWSIHFDDVFCDLK